MMIPDCYEAYRQEEARQRAWDEYLARLPKCCICGRTIHNHEPIFEAGGKCVCFECFDELSENESICDVE